MILLLNTHLLYKIQIPLLPSFISCYIREKKIPRICLWYTKLYLHQYKRYYLKRQKKQIYTVKQQFYKTEITLSLDIFCNSEII